MTNYIIIWKDNGETQYFCDSVNSPKMYTMTKSNELGQAKIFHALSEAENERHHIDRYANYDLATTIVVTDREIFEARLKGE